jgi:outer membrane protein OmpA-like peptidoglycan-associated protein
MTHPIASRRTFLKLSAALAGTALLPEAGAFAAGGDAARRTVIIDTDPGQDDAIAILLALGAQDRLEQTRLHDLQIKLMAAIEANPTLRQFKQQIRIDSTLMGLRIEIVDTQKRPMFAMSSDRVEPYMRDILREIGKTLNDVPNRIIVQGHTDAVPYAGGEGGYSNWELSADRANASRRELISGGMDEAKVLRVLGLAEQRLERGGLLLDGRRALLHRSRLGRPHGLRRRQVGAAHDERPLGRERRKRRAREQPAAH